MEGSVTPRGYSIGINCVEEMRLNQRLGKKTEFIIADQKHQLMTALEKTAGKWGDRGSKKTPKNNQPLAHSGIHKCN